ncbi:MAG: hypothetical protein WB683_19275 [Candidatus Sulfotelmatobacter sp.]
MAFVTDKSELKPGLILFRRGDVEHRMWYCRMKMPKADRYKTVSLKTTDMDVARDRAFDQDADIRFRLKHDVPVFNHPFREVGREYLLTQEARAKRGEISAARPKKVRAVIEGALDRYVGSTQVHLVGDELWGGYVVLQDRLNSFFKTIWDQPQWKFRPPGSLGGTVLFVKLYMSIIETLFQVSDYPAPFIGGGCQVHEIPQPANTVTTC